MKEEGSSDLSKAVAPEDRNQYHNLIDELYQEDQPVKENFVQTFPDFFTKISEPWLTTDNQSHRSELCIIAIHPQGGEVDHKPA